MTLIVRRENLALWLILRIRSVRIQRISTFHVLEPGRTIVINFILLFIQLLYHISYWVFRRITFYPTISIFWAVDTGDIYVLESHYLICAIVDTPIIFVVEFTVFCLFVGSYWGFKLQLSDFHKLSLVLLLIENIHLFSHRQLITECVIGIR